MRIKTAYIAVPAAAVLLAACFFLPGLVSALRDGRDIDSLHIVAAQSITYEARPDLDLLDRLDLVTIPDTLSLKNGKRFDSGTAARHCKEELRKINAVGLIKLDIDGGFLVADARAEFVINPTDPTYSMVVWRQSITDAAGHSVTVAFDDETGRILQLHYRINARESYDYTPGGKGEFCVTPGELGEAISGYYSECTVTITNFERYDANAYYTAEIRDGEKSIAAYGIISGNGFSINDFHNLY